MSLKKTQSMLLTVEIPKSLRSTRACECDYEAWAAEMQLFWAENIRITLTADRGYSIFAREDFDANFVLGEYTRELVPKEKNTSEDETRHSADVMMGPQRRLANGKFVGGQAKCRIDATYQGSVFRFANLCFDPNAALVFGCIGMHRRALMIETTRPVLRGEEITIDYGADWFHGDEYCKCGSDVPVFC
ncbi:hypothetical protein N0V90_006896 [Kalmusia sp. IMI 367209]|nr:hypothetical protein N0V90_006896 [Kalmusia sp. IMI 367209]